MFTEEKIFTEHSTMEVLKPIQCNVKRSFVRIESDKATQLKQIHDDLKLLAQWATYNLRREEFISHLKTMQRECRNINITNKHIEIMKQKFNFNGTIENLSKISPSKNLCDSLQEIKRYIDYDNSADEDLAVQVFMEILTQKINPYFQ